MKVIQVTNSDYKKTSETVGQKKKKRANLSHILEHRQKVRIKGIYGDSRVPEAVQRTKPHGWSWESSSLEVGRMSYWFWTAAAASEQAFPVTSSYF